jgi:hypothetical protein
VITSTRGSTDQGYRARNSIRIIEGLAGRPPLESPGQLALSAAPAFGNVTRAARVADLVKHKERAAIAQLVGKGGVSEVVIYGSC